MSFLGPKNSVTWLVQITLAIVAFFVVAVLLMRRIAKSTYPELGAVESIVTTFGLFLMSYSGLYLAMSNYNSTSFSEPLNHVGAFYFSLVTFATVGFGDITPTSDIARLAVSTQIIGDVLFIAVMIRGVLAFSRHRAYQNGQSGTLTQVANPND